MPQDFKKLSSFNQIKYIRKTLPCVEVPQGILIVAIWAAFHFLSEDVEIFVDRHGVVGIASGNEIGNGTRWNTQSAEDCKVINNNFIERLIFIQECSSFNYWK